MQEIGESRDALGLDVWRKAEEIANQMKSDPKPFYIVYAAKSDKSDPHKIRQAFRMYRQRPPKLIGILVWYVDNAQGIFDLVPDLSIPPDVPVDESLLSTDRGDFSARVAETGQKMGILLS
jgi:hypothetical protein